MGNRAHCLICDSYSSSVLTAWRDYEPCPSCGASQEDSEALAKINKIKSQLQNQKIEKNLAERNIELETENAKLKIEVNLLDKDLWQFAGAIDSLKEAFEEYSDRIVAVKKHMEPK